MIKLIIFIKIVRSIYELYLFGIYYCDVKSGNFYMKITM